MNIVQPGSTANAISIHENSCMQKLYTARYLVPNQIVCSNLFCYTDAWQSIWCWWPEISERARHRLTERIGAALGVGIPVTSRLRINPYLSDFLRGNARLVFSLQIFFLATAPNNISKPRTMRVPPSLTGAIYEDFYIFSRRLCITWEI